MAALALDRVSSAASRPPLSGELGTHLPDDEPKIESQVAAIVQLTGDGIRVETTSAHPAGTLYSGGYDSNTNTLYLSGEIGHPQGVSSAGGDASKNCVSGMRILVAEDRFVFWATDSMSLPRRLREGEATAVQAALESMYAGAIVKRLETLSDAAHPA